MTDRLNVTFPSGSDECHAWLYVPEGGGRRPVLVMAHGLGGVRDMRLDAYAERFAAVGYACLVFDYRHFGASGGQPRQLLSIRRQLQDWRAAVAYARSRPEADPRRVVLWGTSFGGGHVLATAAQDPAVAAVIAQGLFTDGVASALAMRPDTSVKVMARAVRDVVCARLGRPPVMVATAGPPGSAALMTAADAEPGYLALVPDDALFSNQVAARFALDILRYRPGRRTAKIACPVLFCVCEQDSVAPARQTLRHARRAPRGEIRRYSDGHFDIYLGEPFERVVTDQLGFLARHVPIGSAPGEAPGPTTP
ncbi:alpha/beta hydrolase [Streptomyces griseorubiginosus]|uniref:alpha/beta hydrolase n=1 Tax=Streptomyces griseorubiginosus TaxID=67304 RepID=UPI001AD62967|nr:alpha/beta hydrolase [Streptomyces griseorubiginosus]MBO4256156.1 alpha/beta fold hydrolase [Streptomyces griseorubiginosus]